jgi:two-component sensor histidine kinase
MPDAEAAVTGLEIWMEPGFTARRGPASECDFRQLRHHTQNLLQRILLQIEHADDLNVTACGRRLLVDLQRRIVLSAQISDALFSITLSPASMSKRLRVLSENTMRMLADGTQLIRLNVTVTGDCPEPLQQLVLRIAHEFVANAVKHGMNARVAGTIDVHLVTARDGKTTLVVTDDGWGFHGNADAGDGLKIAGDLAATVEGTISLLRTELTVAELVLPAPQTERGSRDRSTGSEIAMTRQQAKG